MQAEVGKRYKHYKNAKEYTVIAIARHSETLEEVVVYRAEYDAPDYGYGAIWVRPRVMFEEEVAYEGKRISRFQLLD